MRVLVTAAGGTLAPLNIRLMRRGPRHPAWVLGVDARADAIGRHFTDAFATVPPGDDPRYVACIVELVRAHGIELVMPWSDEEALALAAARDAVETAGARLAAAPIETLRLMHDKAATFRALGAAGLRVPDWTLARDAATLRTAIDDFASRHGEFVVKPAVARGNRGTIVVRHGVDGAQPFMGSREWHMDEGTFRRDYLAQAATRLPAMVMERLAAPAYDIDVLAKDGRVLRAAPRRRINPAGTPFTGGVLTPSAPLLEIAERVAAALDLTWLYDCDVMTDAAGAPVVIELNPRPSGSIAAAILAGVPFYDDLISMARGEALPPVAIPAETVVIPYTDCIVVPAEAAP